MKRYTKRFCFLVAIALTAAMMFAFQAFAAPAKTVKPAPAGKAAGQAEWEKVVNEARKEGRVVIYGAGIGETANHLKKAFHDRYGITLDFVVGRGNDMAQKLLSERRAGIYAVDIGNGGVTTWVSVLKPANVTVPLDTLIMLDDVKDPMKWRAGRIPFLDREKRVVTLGAIRQRYIFFNTTMMKPNEVTTFPDLLDPKWQSRIVINDPSMTGPGNNWFSYMLITLYGREKGAEYMKKLALNKPVLVRDERLQVEWVAKGRYPMIIGGKQTVLQNFVDKGAPLAWLTMKEPPPVSSGSLNLHALQNAPHPNAQKVFVNWILGKEAGDIISQTSGYPSERADASHANFEPGLVPGREDSLEGEDYELQKAGMPKIAREIFKDLLQ